MMFGTPAAADAPDPNLKKKMMIGVQGERADTPAAPPPPSARSTMMFGTTASNAGGPAAAPAPVPASKATMVFGSSPVTPPPPAKNQTMMFGTPAGTPAPPPPAPPAPAKNQTMMFGTPASNAAAAAPTAPPAARTTIMFGGGAAPPAPQPAPSAKHTMMFGTPASNAAAAPPPPAPPPPSSKQTMVFGQAQAPLAPSKNQTMMFGTGSVDTLPEAPVEETILDQPGQSSRTMLFGTPVAPPNPEPPPTKNQTMMFGRPSASAIPKVTAGSVELAGYAADEAAPNESTVRVDVQQVMEEHGADEQAPEGQPRHDRTQRFAMSETGGPTPPEGVNPVQDRHNRTQLFAMSSSQESTVPVTQALHEPSASVFVGDATLVPGAASLDRAGRVAAFDLNSTLPPDQPVVEFLAERPDPDGVSLLHDPANRTPPEARAAEMDGPVATTLPNLGAVIGGRPMAPLSVELAPEPSGSPQDLMRSHQQMQSAREDAEAARAVRSGGAGRAVVIILAIVALILLAVLVYRLFGPQLMGQKTGALPAVVARTFFS